MGLLKWYRKSPPAHYKLKIESFSLLQQAQIEIYESIPFEAGGYKWKLRLYPKGNIYNGGQGHLSMYLTLVGKCDLGAGGEANIAFRLFMFNHKKDKYLVIQDDGMLSRFHDMKSEWGVDKLLSLEDLNDISSGFLSENESCIFGAEVFVTEYSGKGESLSILKEPEFILHTWTISNYTTLDELQAEYSNKFLAGDQYWKLSIYPNGNSTYRGRSLSMHLNVVDWGHSFIEKVLVNYKLRLKNQLGKFDHEKEATCWFSSSSPTWGYENLISLADLTDSSKGFLLFTSIVVEVEITIMSEIKDFS